MLKFLNLDSPCVAWIVSHNSAVPDGIDVPEQGIDYCPSCATSIAAKINTAEGFEAVFVDGGDDSFSNQAESELVCSECGEPLYTELFEA